MNKTMNIIQDMSEVPAFETEAQEHTFWSTHALAGHLLSRENADADFAPHGGSQPRREGVKSRPTSIRLGTDLERRLRHLAELKGASYQTLLREFVQERVYEEEKRHGVI